MNDLAVREQQTAVAEQHSFGSILNPQAWNALLSQCQVLVKSGFLPNAIKTPEQAVAIALKGHEMGLPLMASFAGISIINGKPTIEGQLMLAQIYRLVPGAKVEFLARSVQHCQLRAMRPGGEWQEFEWTMEHAKQAELLNKDSWKKYPRNMLQWRAVADMARAMFPDAIMGCYLADEVEGGEPIVVDKPQNQKTKAIQEALETHIVESTKADPAVVAKMMEGFAALGMAEEHVLGEVMARSRADLTENDLASLRGIYAKLKENPPKL